MTTDTHSTGLQDLSEALADLVARVAPSVVSLASGSVRASGFVWREGLVVTAEEALSDQDTITVTAAGGATTEATLVGRDPSTDVALLRLKDPHSPAMSLGGAVPRVGSLAIAVGALDGAPTAALGVVSRAEGPWRSLRGGEIDARIVFDVRLPTSGEGGLAFDAEGKVIGMTVFGPRRRVLAIPLTTIERVASRLESHGHIARGYLGVGLYPVAVEGSEQWGAMVMNVDPKGPSVTAGLRQGDVIVSWNREPLRHIRSLLRSLGPDSVGQTVTLGVRRGGDSTEIHVAVAERPAA